MHQICMHISSGVVNTNHMSIYHTTTTHSPTYMYLAASASKMRDMGVEKRREMSMAVSNSPTCTNNATTSPALTNGPTGVEDSGECT